MAGVPLIAAPSGEETNRLGTSPKQRFRSSRCFNGPTLEGKLAAAIIGGPRTIAANLQTFQQATQAGELILTTDGYNDADRLRSFEIALAAMSGLQKKNGPGPDTSNGI